MPWLVVTGNGSYGLVLGRTWQEPDNELAQGRWIYDAPTFPAGKHQVSQEVWDKAEEQGYPDWVLFSADEDEPELMEPDEHGVLTPDDVRYGNRTGVHLKVVEGDAEPEPVIDPEGLPLDFGCPNCERAFPSEGSRERHIEYEHTRRHEVLRRRAEREAQRKAEEKAELRRLEEHEGKLPVWEREAIEQAQPKPKPPVPSNEG